MSNESRQMVSRWEGAEWLRGKPCTEVAKYLYDMSVQHPGATFEIDSSGDASIEWDSPETDDEMARRLADEARLGNRERAEYERLKAKYEGG